MIVKLLRGLCVSILMTVFFMTAGYAQKAFDQYGFGNRAFLVQSALEARKSAKGFWDVPGVPRKTNGNLKGTKWKEMQVWNREKGDPDDRLFSFSPGQGGAAGKYFIRFARKRHWGVNYISGTGKIEARLGNDSYELKHMGGDKWKIYVKPGYVLCLKKNTAKNGTKLTLKPDHNGKSAIWVFYDLATLKSFIPASNRSSRANNSSYKGTLKDSIAYKNPATQYFRQADAAKFNGENANGELQAYLNDMRTTSDQWGAILNIVKAVKGNRDTAARRSMYKAVSEASVKAGSNFAENLIKGKFVEQIKAVARREKDSVAKRYLNALTGKF
jgi:hypothetical protein